MFLLAKFTLILKKKQKMQEFIHVYYEINQTFCNECYITEKDKLNRKTVGPQEQETRGVCESG